MDLFYALYGRRRPACIPASVESSPMLNIPKTNVPTNNENKVSSLFEILRND